jgi:hypothetical protein
VRGEDLRGVVAARVHHEEHGQHQEHRDLEDPEDGAEPGRGPDAEVTRREHDHRAG